MTFSLRQYLSDTSARTLNDIRAFARTHTDVQNSVIEDDFMRYSGEEDATKIGTQPCTLKVYVKFERSTPSKMKSG